MQPDDMTTQLFGAAESRETLSPEELRELLELPPGDDIADFKDLSTIGMGGNGSVFSAWEPGLNREVALKVLRPEFRSRGLHIENFIREARMTAQIDHPNIVPVHKLGVFKDVGVYFTMRKIAGRNLHAIIKDLRNKVPDCLREYTLSRRLEIFVAVCQGIAFAHSRGILHCDLKPSNVMIGEYGEVMVMDWGLAAYRAEKDRPHGGRKLKLDLSEDFPTDTRKISRPGKPVISGTPAYMAPEQAAGFDSKIDERTDIYSLGAILYSLLTLEPAPFDSKCPVEELLHNVIHGKFPRPRRKAPLLAIPRELDAIVMKAMAKNPAERYASATALLRDVRNYIDKYPVSAYRPTIFYRAMKLCLRRPLVPLTLLAAFLAAGALRTYTGISNYLQASSLLDLASHNMTQADNYFVLIRRMQRSINRENYDVGERALLRKNTIDKEYSRALIEFSNYASAAQESLASLESLGVREGSGQEKEMLARLSALMRRQIEFYRITGNHAAMKAQLRKQQQRWQPYFPALFEQTPNLKVDLLRILRDEWSLSVTLPPGATGFLRQDNSGWESLAEGWRKLPDDKDLGQLKSGSYLLKVVMNAGNVLYYPLQAEALDEVDLKVRTPLVSVPGFQQIPEGEFLHGSGDAGISRKIRLKTFLMQRCEVTLQEYLVFWKQISDPVLKERYRGKVLDKRRNLQNLWDDQGNLLPPYWSGMPVVGIPGQAAEAYCHYMSMKSGLFYRLPTTLEREKAARGVDGRNYVWGMTFDARAALLADHPLRSNFPCGAPPEYFPRDVSCYGVSDLAGNVREFVRNPGENTPIYQVMGGSFLSSPDASRVWASGSTGGGENDIGFRCVIELPSGEHQDSI